MSKRYSIDAPGMESDSDLEEDIVLGSFNPTNLDRDLLRADEAVLNDLNKKNKSKRFFFSGRGSQYTPLSNERPAKKKVGFAGAKAPAKSTKSDKNRQGGYAQLNGGQSDDSDSDYPSDIEIDIQAQPLRSEIRQRTRKIHGLLLVFILFFGIWFFYTNIKTVDNGQRPVKRVLMSNGTHDFRPTTIVVSLDGFHPHYINHEITPNLHQLLTQNSGAPYMVPSFPSSTFPNHWTMVTGLYPGNHGIIGNTFYDEALKKQFFNTKPAQSLNPEWWGGQPIWQTASFNGILSAIHMWPGSEVKWTEEAPVLVDPFNQTELLSSKSKRVFSWLDRELEGRPELIMAYVPTVDSVGHVNGIKGKELVKALQDVDELIGTLMSGVESRNLTDIVNFIVVSDHGMAPTSNDRLVYLDDLVEMSNIEHVDGWPLIGLRPKSSLNINALYSNLQDAQKQFGEGKWDVYLREDLPSEWRLGGSSYNKYKSRIAPLWLIPKVGWSITTHEQMKKLNGDYKPHGVHGYNNTEVLMRALFLAKGPYFSSDLYEPFENVALYNILCDTLGMQPAANDGPSAQSALKLLPANWTDDVTYPGLPFVTEILDINSTYDTLFGSAQAAFQNQVQNEKESNTSATISHVSPALPMPTDSANKATESAPPAVETVTSEAVDNNSEESSDQPWWQEWLEYAKSKTGSAKDWVVDTYHSITEHKDPNSTGQV